VVVDVSGDHFVDHGRECSPTSLVIEPSGLE
jgi:hypothetical protein